MGDQAAGFGFNLDGLSSYGSAAPTEGYQLSAGFITDLNEAGRLDAFVPALQGDTRPWYERVAEYGMTRAIDSHFAVQTINKTGSPGTFAGQNGRTYVNNAGGAVGGTVAGVPVLLIAAVVAAFVLLR